MKLSTFLLLILCNYAFAQPISFNVNVLNETPTKKILNAQNLYLSSKQNNILIELISQDDLKNIYYKIEGIDSTWISLENQNKVLVSNLLGGKYKFIVANKEKKVIQKLDFEVELFIWQNWWFLPLIFLFSAIIVSMLTYLFSLYRLRQQLRLQAVRHELEIKALRAQMNPHFIFNSMNTIDAYILRKRFIEASDCLQKFSKLIRRILESSENQTISIQNEIETLQLYIELEQERFSNSFDYKIEVEPVLLDNNYQIPPLLLQPFVENAILHGIRHLTDRKGELKITLSTTKTPPSGAGGLVAMVEDNGIGRKTSAQINKERQSSHQSMGMDITMERISTYQAIYGDKMETKIIDLEQGTRVEIQLPLLK
jgi:two-component sensor histidine kinase